MKKERIKTGVLSLLVLGSVLQATSCGFRGKAEQTDGSSETQHEIVEMHQEEMQPIEIHSEGETVGVVEMNPSIYEILNDKGYSLPDYSRLKDGSLDSYQYKELNSEYASTTTDVNFRNGPDTDSYIEDTFLPGTMVRLIARCENGWYLAEHDGQLGFLCGDYVHEIDSQKLQQQLQNLPEVVPVVQATQNVNVRPDSNTNNVEYGTLSQGNYLEMVRKLDNGWYEVIYEGKHAYVCGDYVKESAAFAGDFSKMVTMNVDAKLYDQPFGNAIDSIPRLETAKVFAEVEGYYYVESNGKIGFIQKGDCIVLDGTYVVVDISDQTATLYRGNEEILRTYVVTGKDSSPSDLGLFDIDAKATDSWLTGADYSTHVNYWMPYNGGEGLHDATWRSEFGGQIYHNSGSHGCVNCPYDAAATLYENVKVGSKVLVKE